MSQPESGFPLTPKIMIQIAKDGDAKIEGTILGFAWGEGEVLLWSANTSIPCLSARGNAKSALC